MSKTLRQLMTEVIEAGEKFPNKWDLKTYYVDLVEEVGELGNAVLIETGSKSRKRQRSELKDSFADIFFVLILMANKAGIDLEAVLRQMLLELKVRQENKDYYFE